MAKMTPPQLDEFLATPRLGMLSTLTSEGAPITVPVWFEWDGETARLFASAASGKIRRIERDPRASLLATNRVGEPEAWVAFDGDAVVSVEGAADLAERLAHRYWDMTNEGYRTTVASWHAAAEQLRIVSITPGRVRTSLG